MLLPEELKISNDVLVISLLLKSYSKLPVPVVLVFFDSEASLFPPIFRFVAVVDLTLDAFWRGTISLK